MAAVAEQRVSLPLLRGTAEGADCEQCPFSHEGKPSRPVFSEHPDKPTWAIVGEGPGFHEVRTGRPFIGASGEEVNKILGKIGRPREELFVGNATLCLPKTNSNEAERDRAASACRSRLQRELAQFPGIPILTLGAVAARAVIPKAALDAIDPPDVPESKQKRQKKRQGAENDAKTKRDKKLAKFEARCFKELLGYRRKQIAAEIWDNHRRRAPKAYIEEIVDKERHLIEIKAKADAIKEMVVFEEEKAKKPKKKKPIKISDIVSTCFDVDIDGTGPRPVIPGIHPAALLRGGGRSIAGSHTPDLAFVNLTYDFGKVDALAHGKDVRLKLNVEVEGEDAVKATRLFVEALQRAQDEGEVAIDLETYVDDADRHHALMAYVAKTRAIGLATKDKTISVLWDLLAPSALSYFQLILVSESVAKTFHNGLYDRTVLKANGYEIAGPFEDSLLGHHSAFPGCAHNLQQVTAQFFAIPPWKSEFRNAEEDTAKLLQYNAIDTGSTLAIRSTIHIVVKKNQNEKTYDIDRKMSDIAGRMHLAGMPVSREVNQELLVQFSKNIAEGREAVESIAHDPKLKEQIQHHLAMEQAKIQRKADTSDFEQRYNTRKEKIALDEAKGKWKWKISGSKHVAALLQAVGVSLHQVTPRGAISTKKDVLESLVDIPVVRDLLLFRENDKLLSTFIWQIFDRSIDGRITQYGFADAADRIHPIWNVHKISGRWASYEPVVSNVPKAKYKKQEDGKLKQVRPNLRRQIKCLRPGRKLVGFDYCLAKGTLIDTPLGHTPIEKLKIGDLVFSYNHETQRPDCSRVSQRLFTGMQKTLRVLLDNGEEVRCTPNHRWLTRKYGSGRAVFEVEAQDLKPGTRLLPLRRTLSGLKRDYEILYSYSAFEYVKTHIAVARANLGPRPEGHDVHHRSENSMDNRPSNLEYKPTFDHLSEHGVINAKAQWNDPKIRRKMSCGISTSIKARGGYHGSNNPNFGRHTGEDGTCPNCDVKTYFGGKRPKRFCSKPCYYEFRRNNPQKRGTKYSDLNHKVVAVIDDGLLVPTYDIEVERDHNFALAAGVFVHNSQLEARNIALISGDEFLCAVFAEKRDIHTECARVIFQNFDGREEKERKQLRDLTKQIEYGAFYGGSPETLWKVLLKEGHPVKLADVSMAVATLMRKMSGVVRWQRMTIAKAALPPYTIKDFVLGRRRVFPMGQVDPSEALNFESQATAAAIMDTGMARMDARIIDRGYKEVDAIGQFHDASAYECWEFDAEDIAQDIHECFTQEYERDGRVIPYPVDVRIGDSWDQL